MPGVDTDRVKVKFIRAQTIGRPSGQAGAAGAGQVGAVRAGGTAAPKPVVPEGEGFKTRHSIVRVKDKAVTGSGGRGDMGVGSQQLASRAASKAGGYVGDDERSAPGVGVDGTVPPGNSGASPTGLLVPAMIGVSHFRNDRQRHQVSSERDPTSGAVEDGHTSGFTSCRAGPSKGLIRKAAPDQVHGQGPFNWQESQRSQLEATPAGPSSVSDPLSQLSAASATWSSRPATGRA